MLAGFKKFILQGNVIDLAVGVVIGAAFGAVVKSFTDSFIAPLIRLITGGGTAGGTFTVNDVTFDYGAFINALITFAMTAVVVYFAIVVPMNLLNERRKKGQETDVEPSNEERVVQLLEQIAAK
jgi:large conductance mechanosensitive channel